MRKQAGFTLIELTIAAVVFAFVMLSVQRGINAAAERVTVNQTVAGFTSITAAAYAFYASRSDPGSWPANDNELMLFLPRQTFPRNGRGGSYLVNYPPPWDPQSGNPPPPFEATTQLSSLRLAQAVRGTIGSAAALQHPDDPDEPCVLGDPCVVQVLAGSPGSLAAFEAFRGEALFRDGRHTVTGVMRFDPCSGLDLQGADMMNAGEIDAGEITVANDAGTGTITTDVIVAGSIDANDIRLIPPNP